MKRYRQPLKHIDFPEGYGVEYYNGDQSQINDWITLCDQAILPDNNRSWFDTEIINYPDLDPYKDLMFLTHNGQRIGTCHSEGNGQV